MDGCFRKDSFNFKKELLSKNYANASLLPNLTRNKLQRKIPDVKRIRTCPALLTGRSERVSDDILRFEEVENIAIIKSWSISYIILK